MKKTLKIIIIIVIVLAVVGGCAGGYFVWKAHELYIGKDAALSIALEHSGLSRAETDDADVELERDRTSARYEIDFESKGMEYEYSVDAVTGEILYDYSTPEHAG